YDLPELPPREAGGRRGPGLHPDRRPDAGPPPPRGRRPGSGPGRAGRLEGGRHGPRDLPRQAGVGRRTPRLRRPDPAPERVRGVRPGGARGDGVRRTRRRHERRRRAGGRPARGRPPRAGRSGRRYGRSRRRTPRRPRTLAGLQPGRARGRGTVRRGSDRRTIRGLLRKGTVPVSLFDAIVLGLVQGLTEFLPVSSSGHLVIAGTILGVPTPGIFVEVALHVATLLAVLIVYRQRVANLVVGALRREAGAWRYIGLLILASVPAGIVGVFFADAVERAFNTPALTGIMLIVTGVILWSPKRLAGRGAGGRGHDEATVASALGMGVAQAFAILPGISRSGSTIATGLWGRLSGEAAAEFS